VSSGTGPSRGRRDEPPPTPSLPGLRSALVGRTYLAVFGLLVSAGLAVAAFVDGLVWLGVVLVVLAVVAAIDLVVVVRRRRRGDPG
jgi:hypothetical protein